MKLPRNGHLDVKLELAETDELPHTDDERIQHLSPVGKQVSAKACLCDHIKLL